MKEKGRSLSFAAPVFDQEVMMGIPVRDLKGVGEKTEKQLQEAGIVTVDDLLRYYPRTYREFGPPVRVSEIVEGEMCALRLRVITNVGVSKGGKIQVVTLTGADESGRIPVIWYRAAYLRNVLKKGGTYVFYGKIATKRGKTSLEHPEIYSLEDYTALENTLQPVYPVTKGLTGKLMTRLIRKALSERQLLPEYLTDETREKYGLSERNYAITQIHFPKDRDSLINARKRLAFDEFLLFVLSVRLLKEKTDSLPNIWKMKPDWKTEEVIENLPYVLTGAQMNVWHQIERDMTGHTLMSRLIQGDVGSGKTIIAFLAMILTAQNGHQAALMAPTEVLARQHFEAMNNLLCENHLEHYKPVLLTGSQTAAEKKKNYELMREKKTLIIIGTHALIQEKASYADLALVVTDEQHRFGVHQRAELLSRGDPPHVLVMSATPIPRTLAIILYGDLDISLLDEMPKGRIPVKNAVVDTSWRPNAFAFVLRQVREGHQAYVICPMVEENEEIEAENVIDYAEELKEYMPDDITVEILHGRMKAKDKNRVMDDFSAGKIQILVSTTVVEVGVNVPNATVMMVENAERFGLAQLHQLRGRVGRGDAQSYCIFVQGSKDEEAGKRLQVLARSNDGFYVASEDLKMRGPGDLFGARQSGDLDFHVADIFQDSDVLYLASEAAGDILSLDPLLVLPQNKQLGIELRNYGIFASESAIL